MLPKALAPPEAPSEDQNSALPLMPDALPAGRQFDITDAGGMRLSITGFTFAASAVGLVLDTGQNPSDLLRGFGEPLRHDSNAVMSDGPYVFDGMLGSSAPSLDSLVMPEARYVGLALRPDTTLVAPVDSALTALRITGTFGYQSVERPFVLHLKASRLRLFTHGTPPFSLLHDSTTHAVVVFNPKQWLTGIDVRSCLDSGSLVLNTDGGLSIDGDLRRGSCQAVEATLRENVLASGRLIVY
jgi:hypothetical protein